MAVQLFFQSVAASSSSVLPFDARCFCNHFCPTIAWLFWAFAPAPRECFEVTRILEGDSDAMKMMQPLDFRVSVYGAPVRASRDDHC